MNFDEIHYKYLINTVLKLKKYFFFFIFLNFYTNKSVQT